MQRLKIRLSLIILLVLMLPFGRVMAQSVHSPSLQSSVNDLIAEVNALRLSNGLPAYSISPILMGTAQVQANYMAAIGTITHTGPGGIQLTQRLLNAGYPLAGDLSLGGLRAENITGGPNLTAAQAVQGWTGDAPHLNTMLSPNLTEIGAGVTKVGETYYMVIDAALPTGTGQPQAYTPSPGNPVLGTSAPSDFIVPIVTGEPDESGYVYHEVQYGHSLWALAIAYGVKIDDIRALNGLGPEIDIYQGDKLLIRKDAPPTPATETVEVLATLTAPVLIVTATSFPTATPIATETSMPAVDIPKESPGKNSATGILIGVVLMALLTAGLLSWLSSNRPG